MKIIDVEISQQSMAMLASFMQLVVAYEIPIIGIKSTTPYGIVTEQPRTIERVEWAKHNLIAFPNVKTRYSLKVQDWQEPALMTFVLNRPRYCSIIQDLESATN